MYTFLTFFVMNLLPCASAGIEKFRSLKFLSNQHIYFKAPLTEEALFWCWWCCCCIILLLSCLHLLFVLRVQREQLAAIFQLLKDNTETFGNVSEGDMEEQLRLYSIWDVKPLLAPALWYALPYLWALLNVWLHVFRVRWHSISHISSVITSPASFY